MHMSIRYVLAIALMAAFLFLPILRSLPTAQAQEKCAESLAKARTEYENGNFDDALVLSNRCLQDDSLTRETKVMAYEMLGLIYVSKQEREQAKDAVKKLLEIDPRYEPDRGQLKSAYVELIKEVKAELKPRGRSKKWLFIGGGAALVAGGAVFLLSSKKEGSGNETTTTGFPKPPARPK